MFPGRFQLFQESVVDCFERGAASDFLLFLRDLGDQLRVVCVKGSNARVRFLDRNRQCRVFLALRLNFQFKVEQTLSFSNERGTLLLHLSRCRVLLFNAISNRQHLF
ncbi:hypothetical protein F11_10975 [Rhodospirillum rubrum F11]|nr:hypothetical protein F11_10975 [Rhodospirillum rubrum F11]MBK5954552.1 hypothetical protein [Rhodospirillum rubrum]HAP99468.1 hypothetical protein [Rhodospirillum rubrum]HCF17622.1 hypothetical protein [Rhodospirillum rubrum]